MKRLKQPRLLILLLLSASMLAVIGCGKSSQDMGDRKKVKVHMENEQYSKANDILEKLIADYPSDVQLHLLHGKCLHEMKRQDEAKRAYRKVTDLDPGNLEAIVARATIEMEQGQEKKKAERPHAEFSQHFYQAQVLCRQALEKSPDNKDVLLVQAKVLRAQDKLDEAIAALDRAITADPKFADAYLLKANIHAGERNFVEAERACNAIINEIDRKHVGARLFLSLIHRQQGEIDQAIAVLADADPSDDDPRTERSQKFDLHFRRGELYIRAGELEKALKEADELDKLFEKSLPSSFIRGSVALLEAEKERDSTKREELYREAVRLLYSPSSQTQNPQWLRFYARALRCLDRNREAIEAYRAAISAAPDFALAHLELGEVYKEDRSDLTQALAHLSKAIEIFEKRREAGSGDAGILPFLQRAYRARESVYKSLGKTQRASEDSQQWRRISNIILRSTEGAPKALGDARALYYSRQFAKSIEVARRGLALLPPEKKTKKEQDLFVGLTALIGDAYSGLNQPANAISAYSEASLNAPKRRDIRLDLIRAMLKNGQTEEAEKMLITALDEYADDATIPTALAQLAEMAGKNAEAARYYQQAIKRDSRFLPAYSLAVLNLEQNETEQAIEVWQLALKEDAGHIPALRGLAVALLQKGQNDAAIDNAQKYADLAGNQMKKQELSKLLPPKFLLACSHACAGQWDKAEEDIRNMDRYYFTKNGLIPYDQLLKRARKRPEIGKKLMLHLLRADAFYRDIRLLGAVSFSEHLPVRRALAELKKAVNIDETCLLAHDRLSYVYRVTNPKLLHETTAAIRRIRPDYAGPYFMQGFIARLGRKYRLAATLYDEGLKRDKENATAMVALGCLLHRLGKHAEAEHQFRQAISRNTNQPGAHSGLGRTLLALGRADEASSEFEQEPDRLHDRFAKRIVDRFRSRKYEEAIIYCREFRELWPLEISMYDVQAKCHEALGQLVEAEQTLQDAIETAPDIIIGYISLAEYYLRRSQPDRAIEVIERGIRANTDSKELKRTLSIMHAKMGQFDKARDILDDILKVRPDDIETLMTKANLFLIMARQRDDIAKDDVTKKEMQEKALAIARKVKRETPGRDSLKARLFIAQVLQDKGNIDQAITEYQEALKVAPEHGPIFGRLAILLFSQKRYARAILVIEDGARYISKYVKSKQAACRQLEGRYPEALNLLKREDDGPHVPYLKANVHLAARQFELAITAVEKESWGKDYADLLAACKDKPDVAKEIADGLTSEWMYSAHFWPDKAAEAIKTVVKLAPKSIFVLTLKAKLQALNRDPSGAVETYKLVDKLANPKRFSIRLLLGNMTYSMQKFTDSIHWYKQALEIAPEGATEQLRTVRTNLAQVYLATRMYDKVLEQLDKIKQLDPDYLPAFQMRAVVYNNRNEKQKELQVYERMIKEAPDNPLTAIAYNNLAYELATLPQPQMKRAIALAEKAHKRYPRSIIIRDTLGWVYFLAGRAADAYNQFKQIEIIPPWNPSIRYHVGKVFVTYGMEQKEPATVKRGVKALQKALDMDREFEEEKPCRDAIDKAKQWLQKNGG